MTQRLKVKTPAVTCASGTHTYLKINQLQIRRENALLLISTTGISAVEVVVTVTSRQINILWIYTIIITELILKCYIQFQNRQQKSYTLYFFHHLTITSHHQESQITQLSCIYIPPWS